jgi:fucose 4-O-acetylase-like acetyltransferase
VQPTQKIFFGRQESAHIKGVAIVMLILHHLFLFPSGNPWFTSIFFNRWGGVEFFLSSVSKLCIPLFFFVSGYGLWQASCHDKHLWKSCFRRLKNIYTIYIITVLVSVLLLFFTDGSLVLLSVRHAVETFLGINVAINGSWWFFIIYVELLLLTPLAVLLVRRFSWPPLLAASCFGYLLSPESGFVFFADIIQQIGLSSLMYKPFPLNLLWFNQFFFFIGFCFAASGSFETILQQSIQRLPQAFLRHSIALFFIGIIILFRYYLIDIGNAFGISSRGGIDIYQYTIISTRADFILGPLLIIALVLLFYQNRLPGLTFLGNQSAPIWLIHGTIIALLMNSLKNIHLWSPLLFFLALFFSILYALTYSIISSWCKKVINLN